MGEHCCGGRDGQVPRGGPVQVSAIQPVPWAPVELAAGGSCCDASRCASPASPISLGVLSAGHLARVCEHCLDSKDATMLRAMGLKPHALVRVCRQGEPCIVEVLAPSGGGPCGCDCATRIGLAKDLATRVMVIPEAVKSPRV